MKTLMTRKIVFGMLMTLVLAFSVQDTADAISRLTRSSGDLQTATVGKEFQIRFSVTPQSPSRIPGYKPVPSRDESDPPVAVPADERTNMFYNDDPDIQYAQGSTATVNYAGAHYYDQESIAITTTGGAIKKVGSSDVPTAQATTLSMYERTHAMYSTTENPHQRLSGGVTLTLAAPAAAPAAGYVDITIDPTTDGSATFTEQPDLLFRVYIVGGINAAGTTGVNSSTDGVELVSDQSDTRIDGHFLFIGSASEPVYYSVEGSGRLYVSPPDPNRKSRATNNLFTSSLAPVFLDTNRGTSKVTAYVSGSSGTATVLYIFNGGTLSTLPKIEITQGNPQTGATDARLEDSLKVRVTDGNNRPIQGVAVGFTSSDPNAASTASMFIPFPGTIVYGSGSILTQSVTSPVLDLVNNADDTTTATALKPAAGAVIFVQTNRSGEAEVYFQLSDTTGAHQVTATLQGQTSLAKTFDADAVDASRSASLVIVDGNNQRSDANTHDVADPLVVRVRRPGGYRIADVRIRFTALSGVLEPAVGTAYAFDSSNQRVGPASGQEIYVVTNAHGEASVNYNAGQIAGAKVVTARVDDEEKLTQYDFQIRQVEFNIDGSAPAPAPAPRPAPPRPPPAPVTPPPSLSADISGAPGSTQTLSVSTEAAARVTVGVTGDSFLTAGGLVSLRSFTGTRSVTITLPNTVGRYTLTVTATTAGGTARDPRTIQVVQADNGAQTGGQTQTGGTVTVGIQPGSGGTGTTATVTVTATNAAGSPVATVAVTLSITTGGGTFQNGTTTTTLTTGTTGTETATLTRGSTPGSNYYITASVPTGYTFSGPSSGERLIVSGTPPSGDTSMPRAAGEPDSIDAYDGDGQRGVPNVRLAEPLVVEVVDANDTPVSNVRVRFRTTIGSGRFSPVLTRTARNGRAQTNFTPTSPGRIRITAFVKDVTARAVFTVTAGEAPETLTKVSGDTQSGTPGSALANPFVVEVKDEDGEAIEGLRISFSVTAGGGSLSETSATTDEDGHAETTLTLGSERGINSVQASVSGVDPVTFSTSIEAKIRVAAANRPAMYWIDNGMLYGLTGAKAAKIAEGANGIAVGGGKIYWTATTGASSGSINSANLDGSNPMTLTSILAVPMGIAVDTAGSKLYWSNARGRIQSANLNGSGIKNVLQNLSNPTDIVVSNGFIYWTEGGNTIRRVNTKGQKITRDVAANLDTVGGLAVGGGKVYWTERTGSSAGTVNGANLNGTSFETLATLLSAPIGISVDTAGSKLYWTNARGRVQSGNLNGSGIKNVVEGLISASKLAIGGANTAEAVTRQPTQPTKKDTSAYDVNGDGQVDNADAALVASAMDTGDAKFDVNNDGSVNFFDLLLVFDNRDDNAAAAPAIVGMKLNAVQIDRIEEQIDLLIATNDRSPAAIRTLVYLQQLLATARPEKTQLFANYPNPFNPETWIPYELATDTHVRITIYNTQGVVIRSLQLGHQSAGYYTGRDRAAYWDGRNAFGEQVASGLYFYQFETDEMSSLRKMVILK